MDIWEREDRWCGCPNLIPFLYRNCLCRDSSFHSGTGTDFYHLLWCVRNDRSSIIPAVWIYQIQSFLPGCCCTVWTQAHISARSCELVFSLLTRDRQKDVPFDFLRLWTRVTSFFRRHSRISFRRSQTNSLLSSRNPAITYTIGVQDIMSAVNAVSGATFIIIEPLLVATAIYFCLCFPTSKLIAYFERRMSHGDKR